MKLVIGVLLLLAATAVWVFWPIRNISGGSFCDRVHTYEAEQRQAHRGKLPLVAGIRVDLTFCGLDPNHNIFNK